MAYITLPVAEELGREFPGIVGPMTYRPETAAPINELVNILLRGESTLTRGERELIATHVSWRNDCFFCQTIHGAVAAAQLGHDEKLVQSVKTDWINADITPKMKALLHIAGKVQQGGKHVSEEDIAAARQQAVTDLEIHDTVLIAAVFSMCNRYVDGLNTWAPLDMGYIPRQRRSDRGPRILCCDRFRDRTRNTVKKASIRIMNVLHWGEQHAWCH